MMWPGSLIASAVALLIAFAVSACESAAAQTPLRVTAKLDDCPQPFFREGKNTFPEADNVVALAGPGPIIAACGEESFAEWSLGGAPTSRFKATSLLAAAVRLANFPSVACPDYGARYPQIRIYEGGDVLTADCRSEIVVIDLRAELPATKLDVFFSGVAAVREGGSIKILTGYEKVRPRLVEIDAGSRNRRTVSEIAPVLFDALGINDVLVSPDGATVYVTCDVIDPFGNGPREVLFAVDRATGKQLWRYKSDLHGAEDDGRFGGASYRAVLLGRGSYLVAWDEGQPAGSARPVFQILDAKSGRLLGTEEGRPVVALPDGETLIVRRDAQTLEARSIRHD